MTAAKSVSKQAYIMAGVQGSADLLEQDVTNNAPFLLLST
jgi:hypothetical protein